MSQKKPVASNILGILNELMQKNYLNDFILVGGTSLALQIKHRVSVDLDLFCTEPFDTRDLKEYSLTELLELYQEKFKHTAIFHVIKSITYFNDAEKDADPVVFNRKINWTKVKESIISEVQRL